MRRFALPAGPWRSFAATALAFTVALSWVVMPKVLHVLRDFGAPPLRVEIAASPAWIYGSVAVALLGVFSAGVMNRRRYSAAWVLVSMTLLLVGAAVFTLWAAMAITCGTPGVLHCCM